MHVVAAWRLLKIRILALLQRKTLLETKKLRIKMSKTALFDSLINEKCCSVDGGRGICPLFSSPPRWIWHPRPKSGRSWNWLMHNLKKRLIRAAFWVLLQAMFMNDWKQTAKRLKLQETTNNQWKKYNSVKHLQKQQFHSRRQVLKCLVSL